MHADGSHRRRLTDTPAAEFAADWSPDGKKILFTRSPRAENFTVLVMNADGSHVKNLAKGIAGSWSPDGKKILYTPGFAAPLKAMNAYGSGKQTLVEMKASDPDWR